MSKCICELSPTVRRNNQQVLAPLLAGLTLLANTAMISELEDRRALYGKDNAKQTLRLRLGLDQLKTNDLGSTVRLEIRGDHRSGAFSEVT